MIWREKIEREAAAGARFGCLYVSGARIVAVLEREQGLEAIPSEPIDGPVPSLIDIYPAAEWDEREAHDLYGVEFEGHDPLKPLVHHPEEPRTWMTPVKGRDVHQVAVGPIHAGVIESGHFRFHLVGEQILALDLRLFYKHRGIEKLVEGADAAGSMRHLGRVCASSNVAIQIALARCWELNLGLEPDAGLRRVRTVLIELERLYNHLNDIGAICAGVGYSPGAMAFASLKERVQRLNTELAGHRFLFDSIEVGGSSLVADDETRAKMRVEIEQIDAEIVSLEARREADLERLELDLSILDKQRADQARRVAMSTVTAPQDGIVTDLVRDVGAVVSEGQALATIAAADAFRVEASVSDFYGPELKPRQRVRISSSASELGGYVTRILPTADSGRLDLFIELDDPAAPAFHMNLRVDVEIITAEKPDVLKVRRGPALEGAGLTEVLVIEGDRAVRTPVRLGMSERQAIEIVHGLEAGDRVIVSDTSGYEGLTEIRIK